MLIFEVYYGSPAESKKEAALTERVSRLGGRLSFREDPEGGDMDSICLTYEFDDPDQAEAAADALRQQGEHVEGPVNYGP